MGLPDILETIRAESEEAVSEIMADAESEAAQILERARAEAGSEEQRLAGSLDDRIGLERARLISRSRLEAARTRRAAREDLYREAIGGVTARLAEVRNSPRYEDILGSLLDEAVATMPGATEVRVDGEDVDVMARVLAKRGLDIEIEVEETPLGGLVAVAQGRTVDNRLATRAARADTHLRFVAGELLPELRGASG